jgi:hypothetical protein
VLRSDWWDGRVRVRGGRCRRDGRLGVAVVAIHGRELGTITLDGRECWEVTLRAILLLLLLLLLLVA